MKKCAGLIYGNELHYLDHLAPLCAILEIPLITSSPLIKQSCLSYYPMVECHLWEPFIVQERLVKQFDTVFYSTPRAMFEQTFFFSQHFQKKQLRTVWCPHGNSDKGRKSLYMEALQDEQFFFLYGPRIYKFLLEKGVSITEDQYVFSGNFRWNFIKKYQSFYRNLVDQTISLEPATHTALYAPTWQDQENSSSFFDFAESLFASIPKDWNLLVKLHPNLLEQGADAVKNLLKKTRAKKNIWVNSSFTPIYPLLERADIYIGDMSSIGYDYLHFNRPLFFLLPHKPLRHKDSHLHLIDCGEILTLSDRMQIWKKIITRLEHDPFADKRKALYEETFGSEKTLETLQNETMHLASK